MFGHGPGVEWNISLKVLEDALGAKFRLGYGSRAAAINIAIERGEVQCRSVSSASFLAREPLISWQKKAFIRILVQERTQA